MNATLPLCIAQALAPFAPPQSMVHQIIKTAELTEAQRLQADMAMHAAKLAGVDHHYRKALDMQIQRAAFTEAFSLRDTV